MRLFSLFLRGALIRLSIFKLYNVGNVLSLSSRNIVGILSLFKPTSLDTLSSRQIMISFDVSRVLL